MAGRSSAIFKELGELVPAGEVRVGAALKLCIVTNELMAFHKNGGLGTATTGLVETAVEEGCRVTVVYTAWLDLGNEAFKLALEQMQRRGIDFLLLQELVPKDWIHSPRKISYGCYWILRNKQFDVIHFNDYLGNGFYSAQAKHVGCAFADTVLITTVHGPTRWASRIDERPLGSKEQQEICFLEERTLEFTDVVLGVSHHLLKWLTAEGVSLPQHSYVHKNIMPVIEGHSAVRPLAAGQLNEVVFFARQDVRKGFINMLEAIKKLAPDLPHVKFTFLGKFSRIAQEHSGAVALDALRAVSNLVGFRTNLDRDAALRYLRRPGVLAVMPSLDENSPCTVFEAICEGTPFIASDVGGVSELIAPGFHKEVLFASTIPALVAKIRHVAEHGLGMAALGFDPETIAKQMLGGFSALHRMVTEETRAKAPLGQETPLVSVVITHFNRPDYLDRLLKTLQEQTYKNFEVVIVDDGSTKTAAMAYVAGLPGKTFSYPHKVIRSKNKYLGAARNTGVRNATGVFVKFQDDDNLPFPHELEYFVRAAMTSSADIVTGMSRFFTSDVETLEEVEAQDLQYMPLGASLPLSLTHNEYGDANALVRRSSFIEDGGFTEIYGVGSEDYEFFVKSESLGRKIVFVPEPLFNYRVAGDSMLQSTSIYQGAMRARSGMRVRDEPWLRRLIEFAHEAELERDIANQAWWRAGKRRFGDRHRQMLQGDAGTKENTAHFLELAASYGRLEDVIHMVLGQNTLMDAVRLLEQHSRRYEEISHAGLALLRTRPRIVKFDTFSKLSLLQPVEDLPKGWNLYRLEPTGLLVHPLVNRVTKVMVHEALPAGTKRLGIKFSHRNTRGKTVRMAFTVQCGDVTVAESGWSDIRPGCDATVTMVLDAPLDSVCDLTLMSTVEGSQDFCWTFADHLSLELAADRAPEGEVVAELAAAAAAIGGH